MLRDQRTNAGAHQQNHPRTQSADHPGMGPCNVRVRLLCLFAIAALVVAGCSDSKDSSTPPDSAATTTTLDAVGQATAYSKPGPHPVGVTTLELPNGGPEVEVWYPAVKGSTGTVTYDVRDFVPPAIRALLTADVPATFSYPGTRDAAVADGSFPVVLFSHGFSGFRLQSSYLTSHLASYGMVVVAPDHPSRELSSVLGGGGSKGTATDSVGELLGSLDLIVAEGKSSTSRFAGHIDAEHVAALGHSAGGGTILGAALDPRVDGYVSMASGGPAKGVAYPNKPSFFLAGDLDHIVSAKDRTLPAYEAAPAPSRFWELASVGHNGFDDFCTFGNGTGIIGVAQASGLGAILDAQPQLRALGEDGCVPPAAPIADVFPVVRHTVTAWLRWLFGEDAEPVGLGAVPAGAYKLAVTSESK